MDSSSQYIQQEEADSNRDGRVRQIEDRPDPKIQEVNHRPEADPVNPVPKRSAQNQADPPLRAWPVPRGSESDRKQDDDAQRDHDKKSGIYSLEESEGDSLIFDPCEMKKMGQDRPAFTKTQGKAGPSLGELIQ